MYIPKFRSNAYIAQNAYIQKTQTRINTLVLAIQLLASQVNLLDWMHENCR